MNINVLKYYIELYKQKNLNKAAINLFITPQGLSKSIKNLESELGLQLLKHEYNQIQFTDDGEFFYEQATELWAEYSKMMLKIQERSLSPSGTLTLGIAYGVNKYLRPDFLETFHKKYENIKLNIIETTDKQVEQMLKEGIIDLGISSCEYDTNEFEGQKLLSVPIHVLCAKGNELYTKEEIKLEDLENKKIISLSDKYKSPDFIRKTLSKHNINADFSLCASEMSYIWDLCYQNKGITLIPASSFPFLPPDNSYSSEGPFSYFKELAFSDTEIMWDIFLLAKKPVSNSKLVQALSDYIKSSKFSIRVERNYK
ncbi:MAG: LysR family transcriptional regulator [Erysipelotrichaceae bacterium]|nr:LysR family transcriptional regulator [Erysipelotrichaceae bacterium]